MNEQAKNPSNKPHRKHKVHRALVHSYTIYLIFFLVGVCFDFVFKIKIFSDSIIMPTGFFFLILASIIIVWAQRTTRDLGKLPEVKTEHFCRGPYCYTKTPTQFGLLFLMLGFGMVANAFFVILFTILAFFISKFIFVVKYDKALVEKYGDAYVGYKKLVKF